MGEWDTHSARSKSALPFVSDLAGNVLAEKMRGYPPVEGLFSALSAEERKELGIYSQGRVRIAVEAGA